MGAWIETRYDPKSTIPSLGSHPVWVRGLKRKIGASEVIVVMSHPVWVRGLKRELIAKNESLNKSHPVWVRGLKRKLGMRYRMRRLVAPRVGAWIETLLYGG